MEAIKQVNLKPRNKYFDREKLGIYSRGLITRPISIPITDVGKNIDKIIESNVIYHFEGKCIVEGFVKRDSCKILTFSSGIVKANNVIFEVVFECQICCPVENMHIECIAKNITKAGIRAESSTESPSPIIVFITRDHQYSNPYFLSIQENDKVTVRVIGQRFELNDKYVSIIAELVEPKKRKEYTKKDDIIKPRIEF